MERWRILATQSKTIRSASKLISHAARFECASANLTPRSRITTARSKLIRKLENRCLGAHLPAKQKQISNGAITDFTTAINLAKRNTDAYEERADVRFLKGDIAGAEADCRQALDLDPRDTSAWGMLALVLERKHNFADALKACDAAIAINTNDSFAYAIRGAVRASMYDYEAAILDEDHSLEIMPNNAYAYANRGWAYFRKRDVENAVTDSNKAIELDPSNAVAYTTLGAVAQVQGSLEGAWANYEKAIQAAPWFDRPYALRGELRITREDFTGALQDLNKAIELDSYNAFNFSNRGYARQRTGDLDGAKRDSLKALEFDPKLAIAYNTLGIVAAERKNFDEGIANFTKAIELNPQGAPAYANRGRAKGQKGDRNGALADFDKAVEIDGRDPMNYFWRGTARSMLKDFAGATADFEKALELKPDFQQAKTSLERVKIGAQTESPAFSLNTPPFSDQTSHTNLALPTKPARPSFLAGPADQLLAKANLAYSAGHYDEAIDLLNSALAVIKVDKAAPVLLQRARSYLKKGDLEKAVRDFDEAGSISPKQPGSYIGRAVVYHRKKENTKALSELDAIPNLKMPKSGAALNAAAWIRATFPEPDLRNGNKATEEAFQACSDSQWQEWGYIDTLAAAYAESGNFEQAVRYEEQALGIVPSADSRREKMESRLALYREHRPYREDPFDH
jgi:tetratricopeptide (TPR) repeat protein